MSIRRFAPDTFTPDRLDHRYAELARRALRIDDDAFAACNVRHVERDHHRQSQALEAQHQPEVLAQIGRIGDADHEIGRALAGPAAEEHVGRDLFIRSEGIETVGAGKIENANPRA